MNEFTKYLTTPKKNDYPELLKHLTKPPEKLWYIGHPVWNFTDCLSVVGSRQPSQIAQNWLDETLSNLLRCCPFTLVSGGARGVDQIAHKVAIRNLSPTIVFLPSGLDHPYPPIIKNWYSQIIRNGGAIVSHLPDQEVIKKHHFIVRNQWIAAISKCTLIVEARKKSGTYMTGSYVMNLGRNLGVMPTHPNTLGAGGLDFIYSGAHIIRDAEDLKLLCGSSV